MSNDHVHPIFRDILNSIAPNHPSGKGKAMTYAESATDDALYITNDDLEWALFVAEKRRSLVYFKVISEDSVARASRYIDLWLHQNGGHVA